MLVIMLLASVAIAVPFVLYPVLLWLGAVLGKKPVRPGSATPSVDLVICAHNEAGAIGDKVRNALALDYPEDRLTVWISSDGSTDETVAEANRVSGEDPRVRVLDLPRTGKAGALITAVEAGSAEVLAFSDANSEWTVNALRALVAQLGDPSVGGVAGDQRYRRKANDDGAESSGERSYWSFDRALKRWQSEGGSAISATGAIYCVRRSLFEAPPVDATDDFMISTGVIAAGYRLVFAENACAIEPPASSAGLEFQRKVRVTSRGMRSVIYRRALLNPGRTGIYAVQLIIHKVWRRLVWLPLSLLVLCAPFAMMEGGLAGLIGSGILLSTALGLAGLASRRLRRFRLFAIPAYVAVVNSACLVATFNLLTGRRISRWHLPRAPVAGGPTDSMESGS